MPRFLHHLTWIFVLFMLGHGLLHADHDEASQAARDRELNFRSLGHAWQVAGQMSAEIGQDIQTKNLGAVHESEVILASALRYLGRTSGTVGGDNTGNLIAALRAVTAASTATHDASDSGDLKGATTAYATLQVALKQLGALYPQGVLAPPAPGSVSNVRSAPKFGGYACPMHPDVTGSGPTPCPRCGMILVRAGSLLTGEVAGGPPCSMTLSSTRPLAVGRPVAIRAKLAKPDGSPLTPDDLAQVHTEKVHLLIIDSSLTDYTHIHPRASETPGEYLFTFTPHQPGSYRVWADLTPLATRRQEYVIADISAASQGQPAVLDAPPTGETKVDGYGVKLDFPSPGLKAGAAATGKVTINGPDGKPCTALEPLMGAYAHIVAFASDLQTVEHLHPAGAEPASESDRGGPALEFSFIPKLPGLHRLFVQFQIGGKSLYAPFTLQVKE